MSERERRYAPPCNTCGADVNSMGVHNCRCGMDGVPKMKIKIIKKTPPADQTDGKAGGSTR